MNVKDFFDIMEGFKTVSVCLYDINSDTEINTDSEVITRDDNLSEEWKSAKIQSWYICGRYSMVVSVIK